MILYKALLLALVSATFVVASPLGRRSGTVVARDNNGASDDPSGNYPIGNDPPCDPGSPSCENPDGLSKRNIVVPRHAVEGELDKGGSAGPPPHGNPDDPPGHGHLSHGDTFEQPRDDPLCELDPASCEDPSAQDPFGKFEKRSGPPPNGNPYDPNPLCATHPELCHPNASQDLAKRDHESIAAFCRKHPAACDHARQGHIDRRDLGKREDAPPVSVEEHRKGHGSGIWSPRCAYDPAYCDGVVEGRLERRASHPRRPGEGNPRTPWNDPACAEDPEDCDPPYNGHRERQVDIEARSVIEGRLERRASHPRRPGEGNPRTPWNDPACAEDPEDCDPPYGPGRDRHVDVEARSVVESRLNHGELEEKRQRKPFPEPQPPPDPCEIDPALCDAKKKDVPLVADGRLNRRGVVEVKKPAADKECPWPYCDPNPPPQPPPPTCTPCPYLPYFCPRDKGWCPPSGKSGRDAEPRLERRELHGRREDELPPSAGHPANGKGSGDYTFCRYYPEYCHPPADLHESKVSSYEPTYKEVYLWWISAHPGYDTLPSYREMVKEFKAAHGGHHKRSNLQEYNEGHILLASPGERAMKDAHHWRTLDEPTYEEVGEWWEATHRSWNGDYKSLPPYSQMFEAYIKAHGNHDAVVEKRSSPPASSEADFEGLPSSTNKDDSKAATERYKRKHFEWDGKVVHGVDEGDINEENEEAHFSGDAKATIPHHKQNPRPECPTCGK
ncbi:hypothetical protein PSEUBRA_003762 [Kalmanozyma brasiliensis GHG001]|uniref:uncharacterized protein n=1 Tax=Kalmanozyma brasiliensis (strain GHG001) TaxID=1365824 RepID=UPI001CE9A2D9|nr:uncharacterized protein PSEUBRA_003762 [Kalmanozyma brasiliensis GHG001]KAF6767286.1 hypothetical protein PSEUBRA_003762 [Kalmanozyma brasiliensis GHG001]